MQACSRSPRLESLRSTRGLSVESGTLLSQTWTTGQGGARGRAGDFCCKIRCDRRVESSALAWRRPTSKTHARRKEAEGDKNSALFSTAARAHAALRAPL